MISSSNETPTCFQMSYLLFSIVLLSSQHTLSSTAMAYTFNKIHSVCRKPVPYPKTENVFRFQIPDHKVSWTVDHPEYKPVEYTNPGIQGKENSEVGR